MASIGLPALDV